MDHNKLWKILKKMGIPGHLTCLLRNLYAGQKATIKTRHRTYWFKIGKVASQGCILSPCLFDFYPESIMQNANAGLDESQTRIKITMRNINNLKYADDATLIAGTWCSREEQICLHIKSVSFILNSTFC